jgi:hypothetical protein
MLLTCTKNGRRHTQRVPEGWQPILASAFCVPLEFQTYGTPDIEPHAIFDDKAALMAIEMQIEGLREEVAKGLEINVDPHGKIAALQSALEKPTDPKVELAVIKDKDDQRQHDIAMAQIESESELAKARIHAKFSVGVALVSGVVFGGVLVSIAWAAFA